MRICKCLVKGGKKMMYILGTQWKGRENPDIKYLLTLKSIQWRCRIFICCIILFFFFVFARDNL